MKIREIISRVRNSLKEHKSDSVFFNKHIYSVLKSHTAFLLKRESEKLKNNIYLSSNIWTPICVEMEPVSAIMCSCINLPIGCTIYRSKQKLPTMLEVGYSFFYKSISTIDHSEFFTLVSPNGFKQRTSTKYSKFSKDSLAFLEDGYLYTPDKEYSVLRILGWFENTKGFKDCSKGSSSSDSSSNSSCSIMDSEFKCPEHLISPVIQLTLEELLRTKQLSYDNIPNKNTENTQI